MVLGMETVSFFVRWKLSFKQLFAYNSCYNVYANKQYLCVCVCIRLYMFY
jgi:hypothetical protein